MPIEKYLQKKFHAWFKRVGAQGDWRSFYQEIEATYRTPQRAYHTFHGHIDFCVRELYQIPRGLIENINPLELSLILHDSEMDFMSADNEERSARFAEGICRRMGLSQEFTQKVAMHIRHTAHRDMPIDHDSQLTIDIDLAIFGQAQPVFNEYERRIRQEYAFVPEDIFRNKRAEILQWFLDKPSIYMTDYFQRKYEDKARNNLNRSIVQLRR
ncbi:MAG: N-methyl-D-aspartate receptor NMDAR2C subunit [Parcubacteria group bacterium]|jgi:predicted metal-dependent HD superfamily phosphohydrolase